MSSFYHYNAHHHSTTNTHSTSSHHNVRGRRAPRISQNSHKPPLPPPQQQHFRSVRKEEEPIIITGYRVRLEAGRSFDLDDDLEFCPNLLTENDMVSFTSSSSDRSSLSSSSPESSPLSHQASPSSFTLNSNSTPYVPASYHSQQTTLKLHQPVAARIRNAIPIVNPSTGIESTPSPARQQHQQAAFMRRCW